LGQFERLVLFSQFCATLAAGVIFGPGPTPRLSRAGLLGIEEGGKSPTRGCALIHVLQLARIRQMLLVTPAMEAGIADPVWSLEEIISLLK
jgi:hypothetical protein